MKLTVKSKTSRSTFGAIPLYIVMTVIAFIFLFPLLITVTNSFMEPAEVSLNYRNIGGDVQDVRTVVKLIPQKVTIRQYYTFLVDQYKYLNMFWNSVRLTLPIVIGQVVVGCMTAYAFSRFEFKFRDGLFFIYIVAMMMPFQVTLVPNYLVAKFLGILNTRSAIILPGMFSAFGVFLLRQFMKSIPKEIEEAAAIDGADQYTIFFRIILPLSRTGIISLAILVFADSWNMVEQPLILLKDQMMYPLSLELNNMIEKNITIAFAGSVVYLLPGLLVFLYGQEYLEQGIETTVVKQ